MDGISVIVCCFNSASRLPATLRHLAAQTTGDQLLWEVVVVDNNSSDYSAEVARREWQKLGSPTTLTVAIEPRPGLSMARKTGLAHAKHDLVLFCDDDNWLDAGYLTQAYSLMNQDPRIGVLGGLNTAIADSPLPAWFGQVDYAYACGPQADQDGEVSPERLYVTGAGMVLRRSIFAELAQVGFQSQLLDRKGEELSSGGDTELCFATALLGYKVVYSSKLKLFHYMDATRLSWDYLLKLKKGHAKSYYKLEYYKKIYRGEEIRVNWRMESWQKLRAILSKYGAYMLYHYYVRSAQQSADIHSVKAIFNYEMMKTHFNTRKDYKNFLQYLLTLKNNVVAYRAGQSKEQTYFS